jgi:hypothetical protein
MVAWCRGKLVTPCRAVDARKKGRSGQSATLRLRFRADRGGRRPATTPTSRSTAIRGSEIRVNWSSTTELSVAAQSFRKPVTRQSNGDIGQASSNAGQPPTGLLTPSLGKDGDRGDSLNLNIRWFGCFRRQGRSLRRKRLWTEVQEYGRPTNVRQRPWGEQSANWHPGSLLSASIAGSRSRGRPPFPPLQRRAGEGEMGVRQPGPPEHPVT